MHTSAILAPLTLAASAAAAAAAAAAGNFPEAVLAARAVATGPASCTASLESMITSFPTPADKEVDNFVETAVAYESVISAVRKNPKINDVDLLCTAIAAPVTPPASLATAYASYTEQYNSWQKSWDPVVSSIAPKCGDVGPVMQLLVAKDAQQCKKAVNDLIKNGAGNVVPRVAAAVVAVAGVVAVLAL
ncbi:hypothetical protein B0H66DRAFT_621186 [Apodospora peruviana]|uniref:Uncharacterized protein n=1 Tax=Apodospora peruviana TaxID=516989 RepID=A0AAE0IEY2_9PEZI|nr:hypothetical protein B0H66DRAFT_621186 [Apodospora peruviana]